MAGDLAPVAAPVSGTLPKIVFDATVSADNTLDTVLSDVGWKREVEPLAQ